jgi:hypothetical protein
VSRDDKSKQILLIAPMDLGHELMKGIKEKKKSEVFDVILIGPVEPHRYYLKK